MHVSEPLRVGGVVIEEVDYGSLSDDDIRRANSFVNAQGAESHPEDPPVPFELTASEIRNQPDYVGRRGFWGANDDREIVASGVVRWAKIEENRHMANARVTVRADYRRQGIARSLLGLIVAAADEEGRSLLVGTTDGRVPAGDEFARHIGAEVGLEQHTNRLVLADVDAALVDRWIADGPARAQGYSLLAVDGAYPDELIEAILEVADVMNTAPRGNLDREDEQWTVEQAREMERTMQAAGTERWSIYGRHDESGELVGFTEVGWNAKAPQTVWQWGTGVKPAHRGHALGKWMKAAMLRRILDERPSQDVRTGNADSNDAMLGINHALGFKPFSADVAWQVKVERVRAYLDGSSV